MTHHHHHHHNQSPDLPEGDLHSQQDAAYLFQLQMQHPTRQHSNKQYHSSSEHQSLSIIPQGLIAIGTAETVSSHNAVETPSFVDATSAVHPFVGTSQSPLTACIDKDLAASQSSGLLVAGSSTLVDPNADAMGGNTSSGRGKQKRAKTLQKRTQLTKQQHREILRKLQNPQIRKVDIAREYGVVKSTISGIIKNYRNNGGYIDGAANIKSRSPVAADVLDDPLLTWLRARREAAQTAEVPPEPVTAELMCEEARRLALLPDNADKLRDGWLPNRTWVQRFNQRHKIFLIQQGQS